MEEALLFGFIGDSIMVKAAGHITARHCPALKNRLQALDEEGKEPGEFLVDLSECGYMDSTFIGVLVGINKKLKKSGKRLTILNPGETCVKLLRGLGVYLLFDVRETSAALPSDALERLSAGEDTSAELLLKAHEELMALSPENRKRFEVLQGILRAKIQSRRKT